MTYVCLQAYLCGKTRLEGLLRYRGNCLLHDLNGVAKAVALLVPKPLFDRYPKISGVVGSINKGMEVVAGQGAWHQEDTTPLLSGNFLCDLAHTFCLY